MILTGQRHGVAARKKGVHHDRHWSGSACCWAHLLGISILYTIGAILLVVGVVLWIVGATGRAVGGRAHYW